MADWQAIKTEYITTDTSYRKLAEKYGVSHVQIGNVGKQEGWVELRRQHLDKTFTKTMDSIIDQTADRARRFANVADKLLAEIEAAMDAGDGTSMSARDIRSLTAAMKDLKEIHGIRSDLDRQEQEARIANLRKTAEKADDAPKTLEVVFAAGPEEWNE